MTVELNQFVDPSPDIIGANHYEFLNFLGGPAIIYLTGRDISRARAMVTLLHGNEPSGTIALFQWLKSGEQPAVNIVCIVASVMSAQQPPGFSHRMLPGKRDLNRCFKPPHDGAEGQLAEKILAVFKQQRPEAVVDIHNTSGSGPSFALATHLDQKHDALTSLFTQRLIITHLRLGALMEISDYLCPTVTIECGGREDEEAHLVAFRGLKRYFSEEDVLGVSETDWSLEVLNNPVRLELRKDCDVVFGAQHRATGHKLVLDCEIEHYNSGITQKGTPLGWTCAERLSEIFSSKNSLDDCVLDNLLCIENNKLLTKQDLKLFMVTTNAVIAKQDCLFYAVKSDGSELI